MRLCFIADGRATHARNWMRHFIREGHELHLISTYPCGTDDLPVASLEVVPLDFSARVRSGSGNPQARTTHGSPFFAALRGHPAWKALAKVRDETAPWAVRLQRGKVRRLVERINPDLVHAMRVTFEGILAAEALRSSPIPLVLSVWGVDFTFTAAASARTARLARRALARADGLHPDCRRDLRLAREWGFRDDRPAAVLPGNGGVATEVFRPAPRDAALAARFEIPEGVPVVINPRGVKPYIRTDSFFNAIPLVLERRPGTFFLGGMMKGNSVAEGWVSRLGLEASVRLLPFVPQAEMAGIFRLADVLVSPTDHDGTPNTLLEAMACGVFPVAGGIESVREWIVDGENGLLCDQGSPQSIADAVVRALDDEDLRRSAAERNRRTIAERADYQRVMAEAGRFYESVIGHAASPMEAGRGVTL